MAITHSAPITFADDPDYDVSKDAWEDDHVVANGSLVAAKLSATATDKVFGRSTAGAGNGEEIALTAAGRALIDDANAAAQLVTLGAASSAFIGCRVGEATAQTITHNTFTALTFNDADLLDTDAYHDPASNNTRLTIPAGRPGVYLITGNCSYVAGLSTGQRFLGIRLNGNANLWFGRQAVAAASGGRHVSVVGGPVALVATDYVELIAFHSDGANLDVGGANNEHYFSLQFLGT